MNNWTSPRPSMIDLGKKSKVALLAGCGGGGDIMNTIPVMNLHKEHKTKPTIRKSISRMPLSLSPV